MTKEEIKKFAAGLSEGKVTANVENTTEIDASAENNSTKEASGWFTYNGEIEADCPFEAYKTREGFNYPEYQRHSYYSSFCNLERGYTILLPENYSEDRKYPVLYMLHGIFGDEFSFAGDDTNGVRTIVTNLAHDGIIKDTIVVCPNMFATKDPKFKPGFSAEAVIPYDEFIFDLVNDLMPHIESTYSVLTGRENTYLAGFSMGGRETLFITISRPELFGYVCAISSAPGLVPSSDSFMTHAGQMETTDLIFTKEAITPSVLISCCGTCDSVVGTFPKTYHELMVKNGMPHVWYEIEGADHNSEAIRSGLFNLFKQISYDKEYSFINK